MMKYSDIPLVKAIPDAILHLDRFGTIIDFKLSQHHPPYLSPEAVGKNIGGMLPEALTHQLMQHLALALTTGEIQTWEYSLPGKHLVHHQEARMVAISGDEAVLVLRDITDRKWAEEVSRQSEQYYRQIIQNLQVGVLIQAPNGEILLSNRAAEKLLGLSEEALLGKLLTELGLDFTSEYAAAGPEIVQVIRQVVTNGDPLENLVVGVSPPHTKARIWLMINILPERDTEGVAQYVVVTLNDISDFKNAEAALHSSEEQYELLVDSIHEAIFLIDTDGLWSFLNPAWEKITGHSIQKSIGQKWTNFVHPDDLLRVQIAGQLEQLLLDDGNDYRQEFRLVTPDQGFRWVEMRMRMIRSSSGTPLGYTGILSDITERKLNEEHAIQLAVQSRILGFQRQLLTNLSHDIRTPLSVIINHSYLLRRKLEHPDKYLEHLDGITQQVQFLTRALEMTTNLTQLIHGNVAFRFVQISINDLIRQVVEQNEHTIAAKSHTLHLKLDPELPLISVDQRWITDTIDNILRNAAKYTMPSGTITISTAAGPQYLTIRITDTGIGITKQDLPHIFEPLYKADKARSGSYGASGLGLAIAKQVVDAHGGRIEVESEEGQGSSFVIMLPCAAVQAAGNS